MGVWVDRSKLKLSAPRPKLSFALKTLLLLAESQALMALQKCTFYPNFYSYYETSYCNGLGTSTISVSSGTTSVYYSRYLNLNEFMTSATAYLTGTTSDYDQCLPGPTSCGLYYFDSPCPSSYTRLSREMSSTTTIDYCCQEYAYIEPSFTNADLPQMNVSFVDLNGSVSTMVSVADGPTPLPLCIYTWINTAASVLPTARPPESPDSITGAVHNVMTQMAVKAVYSTLPATPASASSLPDPTFTPTPANTSKGGLTRGAKAGIGVGVALGIVLILALAMLAWVSKRRRGKEDRGEEVDEGAKDKPELSAEGLERRLSVGEMDSEGLVFELDGVSPLVEMGVGEGKGLGEKGLRIRELESKDLESKELGVKELEGKDRKV
ncbi:hypothetical protein EJ04DRAFT_556950 [Polyplosphaeria fusca]|uniref:Uncharacterized protein n=1 Tax=Polyplosphaeria fusca TaxID=682080 RepID=A0A9P4QKI1_9PLEO|nr:hypothetical protein EJ04DRAFT_556950 [Polyplosphaeria fusca]